MMRPRNLAAWFARDALVSALVASIAFGPASLPALAGPEGFDPRIGGATINQVDATHWEITAPDGSVIQYSSFDIALNEGVHFLQPGADARVLNRILGALPTHIEGSLTGTGHIYIVNPAGVIFGEGAIVDANGIHAAGGHLSDTDFANRDEDHYTGVIGDVTNATDIIARAVSLVGAHVVNSGSIDASDIVLGDGWIVIAAGNDVIIGREDAAQNGRGLLLRVEGAAGAVFQPDETGVTNTGALDAGADGTVRIGAGDLYGTAIFSDSAIRAREIALAAGNRGDIALAGEVSAEKADISFRGGTTVGELRSTTAGAEVTVYADELELSAADTGAAIRVSGDVAFRSQDDPAVGPSKITLEQSATLSSSSLAALDVGAGAAGATRELALRSTGGNVVVDDKAVVAGSHLALAGTLADLQGTDALEVASLAIESATSSAGGDARSEGDIVASTGGISVQGDLQLVTKPSVAGDPPVETRVSAHQGTLAVDGDVTTSAGGGLRIEARDVVLGTTDADDEPTGGSIVSRGDLKIGFVDAAGLEQTRTVVARAIDTRGAAQQAGGNVDVAASGDVSLGVITTQGGAGSSPSQPNADGGSVSVRSTGADARVAVGAIATGGAGSAGRGAIALEAATVSLSGSLSASGGLVANADGARDRAVQVTAAEIQLDANALTLAGSDVELAGAIRGADVVSDTDPPTTTVRRVDLGISASGVTTLGSTADLRSLTIATRGESVVLGGNVTADTTVRIGFIGEETGTISNGGAPVTVSANRVELAASDSSGEDGRVAQVALGSGIGFELFAIPASEGTAAKAATLQLDQDGAIDSAAASLLATAGQGTPDLTLELRTNDAVTLDAAARTALTGTDLVIDARSFSAIGATQTASDFELSSLELATLAALDVDFGVTADSVRLAGALGGSGDLTLRSALQADTIELVAGNGPAESGSNARVVIESGASLRSRDDANDRPTRVDLIQDAALDSADLPDLAVFGGSVAGLAYGLQSTDSSVSLSPGASEKFAGSALELRGRTGVDLGDQALSLASLEVETPAALVVSQQISATDPAGTIRLHAGSDGGGDLTIDARLAANTIELVAGSQNGTDAGARIQLQGGARFSADTVSDARPDHFSFEQDAAIGSVGGSAPSTAIPDLALFGSDIAGMTYALRSNGASLRIDDTSKVNGTTLTLDGDTGIDINGDLDVAGLDLTGGTNLAGNVVSTGSVTVTGPLGLDGAGPQSLSTGAGDLTVLGAITKSGAGSLSLSGQNIDLLTVTTGRAGDSLTISGVDSVETGALDASGAAGADGGDVSVSAASGPVVIASITTRGGNGPVSATEPTDGRDGGAVQVTGSAITIGSVNSAGGNASAIAASDVALTREGGNAGAVVLDADQVTLIGSLDARGGNGSANDPNAVAGHSGDAADVSVLGSVLLGAAGGNTIRGNNVLVEGGVTRAATRELRQTSLVVFAQDSLRFGGDLSAGRIELELANGDLDLAAGGVSEISANTIRLAATDGNGGDTQRQVVLGGLSLANEVGDAEPQSLTIEQDRSIGAGGSPLPPMGGVERSVALISHDGGIEIDGLNDVAAGTRLTLAANGAAGATEPAVLVHGGLDVVGLTVGTGGGSGVRVDGDARIDGDLVVGAGGMSSLAGLVDVTGQASIEGNATFSGTSGTGDQVLRVGAGETLALGGATIAKSSAGKLWLDADQIQLTRAGAQTLESAGQLEIGSVENGSGLVKGNFDVSGNAVSGSSAAGLTLRGSAEAGSGPAITVHGTRTQDFDGDPIADGRDYAIAIADGDLTIDARALPTTGSTTPLEPATWSVDGDVLVHGDGSLNGRAVLDGGRDDYVISAQRAELSSAPRGGELRIAGIASADGDVVLRGEGDVSTEANPNPSGVFLRGEFDVAQDLTLASTTEIAGDTVLRAGGDLVVESNVRGPGRLTTESGRVLFTSLEETQTIEAGSLSFGSNSSAPAPALPTVFRDGDLELGATGGDVQFATGQQLIVAGDLDVSANAAIVLADTAALTIDLNAPTIRVRGGSDVVANFIRLSDRPSSLGGTATFATPTREQISGDIAGVDVLLRQISTEPVELSQAELAAGNFPSVDGPAFFDYASQTPQIGRPAAIARPRADVARLAKVREGRPLWADELLFYLDARSRLAPSAREQGALPPVSAGPNATTPDTAREELDPAVARTLAPYRALFRPTLDVDPESGILQDEDRAPLIRAAFAQAVQVASAGRGGATPTASEVAAAIERDPSLAEARAYRADLAELVVAANQALDVDQRARFRELLLARVAPQGISQAEFDALIP
ncbi:MAG: filamentous hemagglutinin N-terminal domain-containing protein [Myxococcota bacterium]